MQWLKGQPNRKNSIAFCHNPQHKGHLSKNLIKCHKCLDKQCRYLQIYSEHEYWKSRTRKRNDKKLRELIKKNDIEGIGEHIARIIYESSTQEMGDTDIWGQNDNLE